MEQIAPGITQEVAETVTAHMPSEEMYRAMYAEVRELAQTVVTHMNPRTPGSTPECRQEEGPRGPDGKENE